jgi:hypothetical protein
MDIDAASFWRRVNSLIKIRKTKQEAIAKACNIPYPTFRGMVTRKTFPGGDETYLIARALETTVEYLLSGKHPDYSPNNLIDDMQAVIDKYKDK